ncbi:MAG: alpha/beta hydrolase [Lunatimonas sp.]|uniref:alpha/beta hydrolase-fold protein n=1 Tax=Lunatimonas sp. TaxID=2060141 RepID=UPI00263B9B65|nr:alpha/beta hydrolase-fold protein [Lunatimonas sp.]MCC5938080.1 alpha/beta hydrolase [Lunatimonas sp.]
MNEGFRFTCLFLIFTVFFGVQTFRTQAQSTHVFTEGLAIQNQHRYGREVIFTDQVAFQLANGAFENPTENGKVSSDSEDTWQVVRTDDSGRFRGRLRAGYLYLTYESTKKQTALLRMSGASMCYVNGVPRGGDIYGDGWLYLPVPLEKGKNEILARFTGLWSGISAELILDASPVLLKTADATLPDIVLGQPGNDRLIGAVVVVNATSKTITDGKMEVILNGTVATSSLPSIPPMSIRKVGFDINAASVSAKGEYNATLNLHLGNKKADSQQITLFGREATEHYKQTFISEIDGSVQYYGVAPQVGGSKAGSALFLSVHGAGVEGIGQARAYKPKTWGTLVAPTNRRPRGFNWEDWGRIDAMEVLAIAEEKFRPNPSKIYLTGHSMGGHGTWYLGATFAGKWAAIAPCAGYPTLMGYGSADGKIPEETDHPTEKLLLRASNPSNVIQLAKNYTAAGVYIHHGDSDRVVSVDYARQMRQILGEFHPDFSYYEYPGGSHWFGDESVDWKPLFDYFEWHETPHDTVVHRVEFSTANTAVSSQSRWVHILQQTEPLNYSRVNLLRNVKSRSISGSTENIQHLGLETSSFATGAEITLSLDNQPEITWKNDGSGMLYLKNSEGKWEISEVPNLSDKGTVRNGTFKEPFNNRMVYVYGTSGNKAENEWAYNKARFDAEMWYYRGNGAVDIVSDREFDLVKHGDRGIIIYGNADTNRAWRTLLTASPIQVSRNRIQLGSDVMDGADLGAYFMVPRADNPSLGVAVISGTGLAGLHAANANQYFAGGSGFPDYVIFTADLPINGVDAIKATGFYQNDWSLPAVK